MRIPEAVIKEVLRRASIVDVVGAYVSLQAKGDRFWGLSPFKQEKTPSFSVSPERNAYYCFSTQQGGNAINFVMEMEHLTYPEAIRFLAHKYGITIDEVEESSAEYRQKQALEELYQRLAGSFHHLLIKGKAGATALDYALRRGLSEASIAAFSLGYSPADPAWLHGFLRKNGYSPELLLASGLFARRHPEYPLFANRLMFPISNPTGSVLAFGGRLLEGDGPKYINSPETVIYHKGSNLFGLHQARSGIKEAGAAIICEGYMDVIALHQGGATNAVAPLGTAFTDEQATILRRLTPSLCLLFDGDAAGVKATMKSLLIAEKHGFETSIIEVPDAKDPADILVRDGPGGIQAMVGLKIRAFEYILRRSARGIRIQSPEGKEQLVRDFAPYLASMESEVKRQACIEMIADTLSMDRALVQREFDRREGRGATPTARSQPAAAAPAPAARPVPARPAPVSSRAADPRGDMEFKLMLAVFLQGHFAELRSAVNVEDLTDPRARELYLACEEALRYGNEDFDFRLERIDSTALRELVQRRRLENEFAEDTQRFIRDGIKRLQSLILVSRRHLVEQNLHRLNHLETPDPDAIRGLLEEKMTIDKTLRDLANHE